MSKKIATVWITVLAISTIIILWGASMTENVRYRGDKQFRAIEIEDWRVEHSNEPDEKGMYTITYENTIGEIAPGGDFLMFYIYHGDVYTYVDGELLYSMIIDK